MNSKSMNNEIYELNSVGKKFSDKHYRDIQKIRNFVLGWVTCEKL